VWIANCLKTAKTPTVIALGNFDGVHQGHQTVIAPVVEAASAGFPAATPAVTPAAVPTVVTFYPHPQEFFTGQKRLLLTPISEKAAYLEQLGIQQLVLVPFNQALASLTPSEFVEQILVEALQARWISVGQDFQFGCQRRGTVTDLQQVAALHGVTVTIAPLHRQQGERISSSTIRAALTEGDLHRANALLGRPYSLTGTVVKGQQLGRTIGFPTANLQVAAEKFLPRLGVYSVWVDSERAGRQPAVMNLGHRPTVNGQQLTVEVHLLDWSGDLYSQQLTVSLQTFQRPEQKFAGLPELQAQIRRDAEQARQDLLTVSGGLPSGGLPSGVSPEITSGITSGSGSAAKMAGTIRIERTA
jgi:riboflavin kinase/FMN adenylyltransferase